MSGTGFIQQTIPSTELPFVDPKTGRLTIWGVTYLQRLTQGQRQVIENVTTLVGIADFPLGAPVIPTMPAFEAALLSEPPPAPTDVLALHSGARVMDGSGAPEGVVLGFVGDLYLRRDGSPSGALYVKDSGTATTTGWAIVGPGSAEGLLPLVNGDLPGPAIMSDPEGQTVGVPI